MDLLDQLPRRLKTKIVVEFLFKKFMETYKSLFDLKKNQAGYMRKKLQTSIETEHTDYSQFDNSKLLSNDYFEDFITNFL